MCTPRASLHENNNTQPREQSSVQNEISSESDKENNLQNSKNCPRVEVKDENQKKNAQTTTIPSLATTDPQKSNLPVKIETNPSSLTQLKPNIKVQYKINPIDY